jgi:hypothetical protein
VAQEPIERRTRTVHRRVEILEHRCQYCGQWFETRRDDARYCPQPARCRVYAYRQRADPKRIQKTGKRPKSQPS